MASTAAPNAPLCLDLPLFVDLALCSMAIPPVDYGPCHEPWHIYGLQYSACVDDQVLAGNNGSGATRARATGSCQHQPPNSLHIAVAPKPFENESKIQLIDKHLGTANPHVLFKFRTDRNGSRQPFRLSQPMRTLDKFIVQRNCKLIVGILGNKCQGSACRFKIFQNARFCVSR